MAIFSFTGADGVRMTSLDLSFLRLMAIDQNSTTQVHWAGTGQMLTLTGSGFQASVSSGHLTGLSGDVTGLFATFDQGGQHVQTSLYDLSLDGTVFYNLLAAKDWHGLLDLFTAGKDQVIGTTGKDLLSGGDSGDMLGGMDGADKLLGGRGNDSLPGGNGADTLVGGKGCDQVVFDTAIGKSADTVTDFKPGEDSIQLWRSFFADIGPRGVLGTRFEMGSAASHVETRVVYNAATGDLSYDQDGSRAAHVAVVFAHLDAGLVLTGDDFTLVN